MERTLAHALLPQRTWARDLSLVLGGASLTALGAQIQIPWQPVPFTLQTLAVMLCGLGLGRRLGVASQLLYVSAGAAGLPIFAGAAGGWAKATGMTGGYILAFIVTAWLLGALAERGWTQNVGRTALAFLAGIGLTLGLGTLWLAAYIGLPAAWRGGCAPFLGVELLKAAIALPLLPAAWRLLKRSA